MSDHESNSLSGVFNQAELSMGTDMYQANLDLIKAQTAHCKIDAETHAKVQESEAELNKTKAKSISTMTNVKASIFGIAVLASLATSPAWIVAVYKWAFNA